MSVTLSGIPRTVLEKLPGDYYATVYDRFAGKAGKPATTDAGQPYEPLSNGSAGAPLEVLERSGNQLLTNTSIAVETVAGYLGITDTVPFKRIGADIAFTPSSYLFKGTLTTASRVVTGVSSFTGLGVGMGVSGTGVVAPVLFTCRIKNGSKVLTEVTNFVGLTVGQVIAYGTFPIGTKITAINEAKKEIEVNNASVGEPAVLPELTAYTTITAVREGAGEIELGVAATGEGVQNLTAIATKGGNATIILWNQALALPVNSATDAHVVISPQGWQWDAYRPHESEFERIYLNTPLPFGGNNPWAEGFVWPAWPQTAHVEVDVTNGQGTLLGPDGVTYTVTDTRIGEYPGFQAQIEVYQGQASSDVKAAFAGWDADTLRPQDEKNEGNIPTQWGLATLLGAKAANAGLESVAVTWPHQSEGETNHNHALTNTPNEAIPGIQTITVRVPKSGKVHWEAEAFLTFEKVGAEVLAGVSVQGQTYGSDKTGLIIASGKETFMGVIEELQPGRYYTFRLNMWATANNAVALRQIASNGCKTIFKITPVG